MIGRTNILRSLRRRTATLGRFVCLLFAFATVSAAGAPCFAMGVSSNAVAQHDEHAHHVSASQDRTQASLHDHATSMGDADLAPSPCPHCPLSTTMAADTSTGSHAYCSAADEAADSGKSGVSLPLFKYILSVAVSQSAPVHSRPSSAWSKQLPVDATYASVALNLRHCVFLI